MDTTFWIYIFLFLFGFLLCFILIAIQRAHTESLAAIIDFSDMTKLWLVEIRNVCEDVVCSQNRRLANKSLRWVFGRYKFRFLTSRYNSSRVDYKNYVISAKGIGKFQVRS